MNAFNFRQKCPGCPLIHMYWVTTGPGPIQVEPVSNLLASTWPICYNCETPLTPDQIGIEAVRSERHVHGLGPYPHTEQK